MPQAKKFSYYRKLTASQKRVYDRSDSITSIKLPQAERFTSCIADLERALAREDKSATQSAAQRLLSGLCTVFDIPQVSIKVLAKRPSRNWGELHGLYEVEEGERPGITVWMRTAKLKNVVAFKTFLRTVVHEFMHHLDYAHYKLADSFHTQGFYQRESSLIKALTEEFILANPAPTSSCRS